MNRFTFKARVNGTAIDDMTESGGAPTLEQRGAFVRPLDAGLRDRIQALVGDVDVNLDEALSPDDE